MLFFFCLSGLLREEQYSSKEHENTEHVNEELELHQNKMFTSYALYNKNEMMRVKFLAKDKHIIRRAWCQNANGELSFLIKKGFP